MSPTLQFTGFIDDLSTFVNGKISIVPIRIGSGMRIKLLDSVWAASPIVTTSKGCEGLPFANEKNCLIADSAQDFANAIMQMLANKDDLQKNLVETASDTISGSIDTAQLIEQRMKFYRMIERIQ